MVKIDNQIPEAAGEYSTSKDLHRLVMEVSILVSLITGAKSELNGIYCCSILIFIML
jgi:hypothetical protein